MKPSPDNLNDVLKNLNLQKLPPFRFDLSEEEKRILESVKAKEIRFDESEKAAIPLSGQLQLL